MGLPSKKRTNRSKRDRNSHIKLTAKTAGKCANCNAAVLPHQACKACGHYKGKSVVDTQKRTDRLVKRAKKVS
ncbi:MAG: 50S ribosomal protein L32 [Candidatus Magasanikbacteria bacterium]